MSQVRVQAWVERDCLRPADVVEALAEAGDDGIERLMLGPQPLHDRFATW